MEIASLLTSVRTQLRQNCCYYLKKVSIMYVFFFILVIGIFHIFIKALTCIYRWWQPACGSRLSQKINTCNYRRLKNTQPTAPGLPRILESEKTLQFRFASTCVRSNAVSTPLQCNRCRLLSGDPSARLYKKKSQNCAYDQFYY